MFIQLANVSSFLSAFPIRGKNLIQQPLAKSKKLTSAVVRLYWRKVPK